MSRNMYKFLSVISSVCLCLGVLQADDESSQSGPNVGIGFGPGVAFCSLPSSLGFSGSEKLLEDCESLDRFKEFPPSILNHYGSSIVICCPTSIQKILFPIEEEYEAPEYDYDYDYATGPEPVEHVVESFESHECHRNEKCVTATECHFLENRDSPPPICGWYPGATNYAVCCEDSNKPRSNINVRTSAIDKYDCDDYVPECSDWASKFPSSCTNVTHRSFSFMIKSCMKSCGICGNKGCVDEFDKCGYWSRKGHCVNSPEFMSINCRESCGICGFRSIRNNEEQLVNGREYSNLEHSKFFCGRSKLKRSSEVPTKDNDKLLTKDDDYDIIKDIFESRRKRDLPELQDSGEFFYYKTEEENSNRRIICASTTISDRFIISAAHCYINFKGSALSRINSIVIRDDTNHTEEIEMKRIFTYPSFQLPSLYNDIAVIELGRRIQFDYDTFGDSPSCIGRTEDTLVGQEAISQGYGFTEDKVTSDILLESVNNIISNSDCADFLSHNSSSHINYQTRLKRALINGINDQLVCTMGQRNETSGVYSGPCEGDSGGPLYVKNDDIQSLAGIVSGGLGCGLNIPKWYTRVSSYIPWIKCIISNAKRYPSQSRVEFACAKFIKRFTPKNLLYT